MKGLPYRQSGYLSILLLAVCFLQFLTLSVFAEEANQPTHSDLYLSVQASWRYEYYTDNQDLAKKADRLQQTALESNSRLEFKSLGETPKPKLKVVIEGEGTLKELRKLLLSNDGNGKRITARPLRMTISGRIDKPKPLTLVIQSNISTGYLWQLDDETLSEFEGSKEGRYEQTSPLIGSPGRQVFVIKAHKGGSKKLTLSYKRNWEADYPDSGTLQVNINGDLPELIDFSEGVTKSSPELNNPKELLPSLEQSPVLGSLPSSFDWRQTGNVTSIKNQLSCGSCWAFATVSVLESAIRIKSGTTTDLSEQFLISCNKDDWDCDGGWFAHDYHFNKIAKRQSQPGAVLEKDMPYTNSNGTCISINNHPYTIASWAYVAGISKIPSVSAIKEAIYNYGPIAAAVCAGNAFTKYKGGVFSTDEKDVCDSEMVNHAIVLLGWNDSDQTWILGNSWGTGWGESGYMRIKWGTSNVGFAANYINYRSTCSYTLNPISTSIDAYGGTGTVNVLTQSGCSWTSSSNVPWISIIAGSGVGSGTVQFAVAANPGSARTGTITIAGNTFTVNQSSTPNCTYSIEPTSMTIGANGGNGSVSVTTQSNCAWTVSNSVGWVTITSGSSGTGSATVNFTVSPNPDTTSRVAVLTIAGRSFTITQQAPTTCTYNLNSLSNSFGPLGGSGSVVITTQSGCSWTATSNVSWISITSGSSGTGSGAVGYSVGQNNSSSSRTGTLTIGGQIFTVNQQPGQTADIQLNNDVALNDSIVATSGGGSWKYYYVNLPDGVSNLTVQLYNMSADLDLYVMANTKPNSQTYDCASYEWSTTNEQCVLSSPSSGTWWIGVNNWDTGNVNYTIKASWTTDCVTSVTPSSVTYTSSGGSGIIKVTASASCSWKVTSTETWLTITSGSSGIGSAVVNYQVSVNNTSASRTAVVTIGSHKVTITQTSTSNLTNHLKNPGFEEGRTKWTEFSLLGFTLIEDARNLGGLKPRSGNWAAWLGGYNGEISSLRQMITIPVTVGPVFLRLWYNIYSEDDCGYDYGYLRILSSTGLTVRKTLETFELCESKNTNTWMQSIQYDLSEFKGQTVVIEIRVVNDNTYFSSFYVDDVEVSSVGSSSIFDTRFFVEQQYRDFLDREGDPSGINYWIQELQSGKLTRAQVVLSFLNSEEFQSRIAPIARLYFAYFKRIPDYEGLMYWIKAQSSGMSLSLISESFALSDEFKNTYGTLSNEAFIDLVYQNVLNRKPDSSGRSYWLSQMSNGMSRGQVMLNFSESEEYRKLSNNKVQVALVYVGMLRRSPDIDGFNNWVRELDAGKSLLELITSLLESQEYMSRF